MSHVRVFRYGLLPPTENADVVLEQMRLAHRYRNVLIEIERGRRAAIREAQSKAGDIPALEETKRLADEECRAADLAIHAERAQTRRRSETPEMRARLEKARQERAAARIALQTARKLLSHGELAETLRQIGERAADLQKNARSYSGLARRGPYSGAFGTYKLAETAMEQSRSDTPFYEDPRFVSERDRRRFRIGVEIQGGLSIDQLFGGKAAAQVAPVDEAAWHDRHPGERRAPGTGKRARMRTTLRLRLGTRVDTDETLFGAWPMIMHREIPKGAVVKRVDVTRERIGRRDQWYVCFTTDLSACLTGPKQGTGRVAVNFGWRTLENVGLRVAYAVGGDGREEEERLLSTTRAPDGRETIGWLSYAQKPSDLHRTRMLSFQAARDALAAWAAESATPLPEWFTAQTKTLAAWKSPNRLYDLARRWRQARFAGDDEAYVALEAWRYREHHLEDWESSQRAKAERQRREQYRIFAKRLSDTYGELVLMKFDRRSVQERPDTLDGPSNDTARRNQHLASTGSLEIALRQAFARAGGTVVEIDGAYATLDCALCGHRNTFDAATAVAKTCATCHATWDQDANMCKNLLLRCERENGPWKVDSARTGTKGDESAGIREGKWARRKREKVTKALGTEPARKADGIPAQ